MSNVINLADARTIVESYAIDGYTVNGTPGGYHQHHTVTAPTAMLVEQRTNLIMEGTKGALFTCPEKIGAGQKYAGWYQSTGYTVDYPTGEENEE